MTEEKSLYARLGGYDAIAAVSAHLVGRARACPQLGRFWAHRGEDGVRREVQLLIDFLCAASGGPLLYTGRDMKTAHQGMRISEADWSALVSHLQATLAHFQVPATEQETVEGFVQSLKAEIVEA